MKTPQQRAARLLEIVKEANLPESEFSPVEFLKYARSFWAQTDWSEEYQEECLQALCDALYENGYLKRGEA